MRFVVLVKANEHSEAGVMPTEQELAAMRKFNQAVLATGSVSGQLLGKPSAELRAKLADSPVGLFTPFLSM